MPRVSSNEMAEPSEFGSKSRSGTGTDQRQAVTRGSQQRADRQCCPWIEERTAKEKLRAIQRKNQLEHIPKACLNSDGNTATEASTP